MLRSRCCIAPQSTQGWEVAARAKTGASGRYSVRVKPRRSGSWRAQLPAAPQPQAAPAVGRAGRDAREPIDGETGSERVTVRSRTSVRVRGRDDLGRTHRRSPRQGDAGRCQAPRRRRHRRQADRDAGRHRRALQRQLQDAEHRQLPGRGQGAHEPVRHRQPRVGRRDHGLSRGLGLVVRPWPVRQHSSAAAER